MSLIIHFGFKRTLRLKPETFRTSITQFNYLTVSVNMLFRECVCKNAGVVGYVEAFTYVLSGKQASET